MTTFDANQTGDAPGGHNLFDLCGTESKINIFRYQLNWNQETHFKNLSNSSLKK